MKECFAKLCRKTKTKFNCGEFDIIRNQAGLNSYKVSVKEWSTVTGSGKRTCAVHRVIIDNDYQTARKYWKNMKSRMIKEGANFQLVTDCYQLKMEAHDGKMRMTDVGTIEQIFRLLAVGVWGERQAVPGRQARPHTPTRVYSF